MKMRKRVVFKCFLTVILTAMLLAGCGAKDADEGFNCDSIPGDAELTVSPTKGTEPAETDALTRPIQPSEPEVKPSKPETPVQPSEPEVKPSEPETPVQPSAPEVNPSEPVNPPQPTQPVDPPKPTQPEVKPTQPVDPPKPTQPEVKPTQPVNPPKPPKPDEVHKHKYTDKVVAPTCTEKGYTLHTCTCGHSYKDSYKDALGHKFELQYTVEANLSHGNGAAYACPRCGTWHMEETGAPYTPEAYQKAVVDATLKYINQFRMEEGAPAAIMLPGLTKVAQLRAVQLQTNYEHSVDDLRAALAYYKYGEWIDGTQYGGKDQYYSINGPEAIWRSQNLDVGPDAMGLEIARTFRSSSAHWSYLGSAKYRYIGIGITYDAKAPDGWRWKICTLQTNTNYG